MNSFSSIAEVSMYATNNEVILLWAMPVRSGKIGWTGSYLQVNLYTEPAIDFGTANLVASPLDNIQQTTNQTLNIPPFGFESAVARKVAEPSGVMADYDGRYYGFSVNLSHINPMVSKPFIYFSIVYPAIDSSQLDRPFRCWAQFGFVKRKMFQSVYSSEPMHLIRNSRERRLRLQKQLDESIGRCIARWIALGLSTELATEFAHDPTTPSAIEQFTPKEEKPLVILSAPIGSGKSLIAERILQKALSDALNSPYSRIPLYLEGVPKPSLTEYIDNVTGILGDYTKLGAILVIDGADEAGFSAAYELVRNLRALIHSPYPVKIFAVLTLRPNMGFERFAEEQVRIPELSDEQSLNLMNRVLHDPWSTLKKHNLHSLHDSVSDAIKRPLFAILYALYHATDARFRSKLDLVTELIQQGLQQRRFEFDEDLLGLLQQLAMTSLDRGGSFVDLNEITPNPIMAERLLNSNLLVTKEHRVKFALPIFTQWFAAQSLANGVPDPAELVSDIDRLEQWYQPLIILTATHEHQRVTKYLKPLLEKYPLFACKLINQAISGWNDEPNLPAESEIKRRFTEVTELWIKTLGDLSRHINLIDDASQLYPFDLSVDAERIRLSVEWEYPDRSTGRQGKVAPQSAWMWEWIRSDIGHRVKGLIDKRTLPTANTFLHKERFWKTVVRLIDRNKVGIYSNPVPIVEVKAKTDSIRTRLDEIVTMHGVEGSIGWYSGGEQVIFNRNELQFVESIIQEAITQGLSSLMPPWPVADVPETLAGYAGYQYTTELLVERLSTIYLEALNTYQDIVLRWFPAFASEMNVSARLPAHFHGKLHYSGDPWLHWFFEPLPLGSKNKATIFHGYGRLTKDEYDWEENLRKLRQLRPYVVGGLATETTNQFLSIVSVTPVTDIVYEWLKSDLNELLRG